MYCSGVVLSLLLLLQSNRGWAAEEDSMGARIVGGNPINIKDCPYQVAILIYDEFGCGGTIIREDTVVTAAHCLKSAKKIQLKKSDLKVHSGSSDFQGGTLRSVFKYVKHPEFIHPFNDVALVTVETPFVYDATTQPARLPLEEETLRRGMKILTTGWGDTSESWNRPERLLAATLVVVVDSVWCGPFRKGLGLFCATSPISSICYGDSGGPAVLVSEPPVLVGVTSTMFGKPCANGTTVGFTDLTNRATRRWIMNTMGPRPLPGTTTPPLFAVL